jgi:hypothetical protein
MKMKRIGLTVVLVLSLSWLEFAQQPNKSPGTGPVNQSIASVLEGMIRQAWRDYKDKKREAFAKILADDVIQVEDNGRGPRDKQATLADMENVDIHKYELSDFKFTPLGASAAMETYKAVVDFTADGQNMNVAVAIVEVWVKRGKDWKLLHYQETEVK